MKTIPSLFQESVQKYPGNTMMYQYGGNGYEPLTYAAMGDLVRTFANGLLAIGLHRGDHVVLLSEERNDWVMSELAVICAGAVNVPVSVRIKEIEDLCFRINHSEASMVIVSARHASKVLTLLPRTPGVRHVILLDPMETQEKKVTFREEVMKMGIAYTEANPGALDEIMTSVGEDDVVNICYTSGTTADPKGIMLTHKNYYVNVEQAGGLFEIPEWYSSLVILPWDHSFAHTCGIYALMKNGASLASIQLGKTPMETIRNIPLNIREIKPHFLLSVPALAKNFRKNIEKGVEAKGAMLKKIFDHGIRLSIALYGNGYNRTKVRNRWWKQLQYNLINRVLFKKIRENFGGRLKFFVGGGALLDIDLQYFFYALGIPMYQGYGLTEAAPIISSNSPDHHKLGSSGKVVDHLDIMICDLDGHLQPVGEKGEIVVRGDNVMKGYWKNEGTTTETIRNGWLYTGDMGYLDQDRFLYVLGRFKSLLIGSDGEKYSPEGIEEAIIEKCPMIDQIILINNQHPYTSAILVVNRQAAGNLMRSVNLPEEDALGNVLAAVKLDIDRFREGGEFADWFPQRWIPSAVAVADVEFNDENQMVNSTGKIVRGRITDHFAGKIERLFTPEGREITSVYNREALKKFLG